MRRRIRNGVRLKYVQTIQKGGKAYRYLRIPGQPRVALPDLPPDDPRFLAAYAAAMAGAAQPVQTVQGSIGAAVAAYLRGARHRELGAAYGRIIETHLRAMTDTDAKRNARLADLRPRHIAADLARLPANPARQRLKAWRLLCGYAVTLGLIHADPSRDVRPPPPPKSDGHPPWTADQIAAYRARWPLHTPQRRAMELLYWTGARVSDAVRLGPAHVDAGGVLTFRQQKTGKPAFVPWTCPAPRHADPADRDLMHAALRYAPPGLTWLVTEAGRTRTAAGLANTISAAARAAGIKDRSAHGLRKARAVALAEGGATPHQIGAWTGHATLAEITHYTEGLNRRAAVIGEQTGTADLETAPTRTVNRPTTP